LWWGVKRCFDAEQNFIVIGGMNRIGSERYIENRSTGRQR
jgi:hypothetical protein